MCREKTEDTIEIIGFLTNNLFQYSKNNTLKATELSDQFSVLHCSPQQQEYRRVSTVLKLKHNIVGPGVQQLTNLSLLLGKPLQGFSLNLNLNLNLY